MCRQSLGGQGLRWTSDQASAETSTCTTQNTHNRPLPAQHTTLTTDLYLHNTQHSQQTSTCTKHNTHNRPLPVQHTTLTTDLYLHNTQHSQQTSTCTTHKNHKTQTPMPAVGFEPTIPASEQLQIHALDSAPAG